MLDILAVLRIKKSVPIYGWIKNSSYLLIILPFFYPFIVIYWIGSILGAVLGSKLYPTVKSKIYPEKLTKKTQ